MSRKLRAAGRYTSTPQTRASRLDNRNINRAAIGIRVSETRSNDPYPTVNRRERATRLVMKGSGSASKFAGVAKGAAMANRSRSQRAKLQARDSKGRFK